LTSLCRQCGHVDHPQRGIEASRPATNTFNLDAFQLIYIVLMLAIVQGMVGKLSECLKFFSVKVGELNK